MIRIEHDDIALIEWQFERVPIQYAPRGPYFYHDSSGVVKFTITKGYSHALVTIEGSTKELQDLVAHMESHPRKGTLCFPVGPDEVPQLPPVDLIHEKDGGG